MPQFSLLVPASIPRLAARHRAIAAKLRQCLYLYLQKAQEKTSHSAFRIWQFVAGASSHSGGA